MRGSKLFDIRASFPAADNSRRLRRPGISLLEVLISMFVLLFGLMGVAAIFPVGNHYATQGDKYDRDVALVDAAFAELSSRGMLQSDRWIYAISDPFFSDNVNTPVISQIDALTNNPPLRKDLFAIPIPPPGSPGNLPHPGYAFVIDPLGTAAGAAEYDNVAIERFPLYDMADYGDPTVVDNTMPQEWRNAGLSGNLWPVKRITLDVDPRPGVHLSAGQDPGNPRPMTSALAETVFRLRDDLTVDLPKEDDRPGVTPWLIDDAGTPDDPEDDLPLTRAYRGNYSWIATIVPTTADVMFDSTDALEALQPGHTGYGQKYYDVSVAVFHKRSPTPSPETERSITAELQPGGELVIYDGANGDPDAIDAAVEGIRPGTWIAVAGVLPPTTRNGSAQLLIKWYRILALDDETGEVQTHDDDGQLISPVPGRRAMLDGPDWPNVRGLAAITNLRAFILPGVIGVTTRSLPMEVGSGAWSVQNYPLQ